MQRPVVDLPHPLSPPRPSVSPRRMKKLLPWMALTAAIRRWKMIPAVTGKYILRSRMSTRTLFVRVEVIVLAMFASGLICVGPPLPHIHPAGGVVLFVDQHKW